MPPKAPPDSKPQASALASDREMSNLRLIGRLLAMTWRYRFGCLAIVSLHVVMYALALIGLTAFGIALDVFRHHVGQEPHPVHWPLGLIPPDHWTPMAVISLLAGAMLASAIIIGFLQYAVTVIHARVAQHIVVAMRRRVYDKLQRLGFRFFDASSSASLINRVTGDVQAVRMFMDHVVVQVILADRTSRSCREPSRSHAAARFPARVRGKRARRSGRAKAAAPPGRARSGYI
jgi:ATP-binding cassette subfamily B protein